MATKIRGITIEIGGDTSPLAKALKDLNSNINQTQKELKDVDKLLNLNPDSTVLLTQKQELLEKQLADTRDKFSKLHDVEKELQARRAQDRSNEALESQYKAVQREIISTENAIGKLETAYTDVSAKVFELSGKVDDSSTKHKTFKERVTDVVTKLKEFVTGNKQAASSTKDTATELNSKIEIWNRFGNVVGNVATKLFNFVADAGAAADDINTLSAVTGLSTETLQKFQYASDIVDVSLDTLQTSLRKLTMSMDDARNGSTTASEAFAKLGVRVTDSRGQLKDSETVFYEVVDALGKIGNETERDAICLDIFGRSATELNPLIKSGSQVLKEYGEQAEAAGAILSQEALDGANRFNDALDVLKATLEGVGTAIGAELAESLAVLLEMLLPVIVAVGNLLAILAGIDPTILIVITTITTVLMIVIKVITAVNSVTSTLKIMDIQTWKTVGIILVVIAALTTVLALIAAISGKKNDLKEIGSSISEINRATNVNSITSAGNNIPRYANGTNYHPGGLAFITEFAPEQLSLPNGTNAVVMPRGTKVNPNVSGFSGGDVFNITIDAKNVQEFNDIVRLAQNARRERRAK